MVTIISLLTPCQPLWLLFCYHPLTMALCDLLLSHGSIPLTCAPLAAVEHLPSAAHLLPLCFVLGLHLLTGHVSTEAGLDRSWQLPCLPQGRLTGCPWCPPPPGAGCTPPAKRTNSKVWQKWWWSDVFNILIYCNSPMIQSNKINTKHISSSDLNAQTSFLFRIKFKGFINRCSTD